MDVNSNNYLSLIFENDLKEGIFSKEELNDIQYRLWSLLGKRTECFTMGDSSSVPIETAEELLKSIFFCINIYLKSSRANISILKNEDIEKILKLGFKEIVTEIEIGKELLKKAMITALPIENISYNDTLQGIAVFFKKYDYRFFAHEIPCDIDYQLCHAVSEELQGIEFINEYLHRFIIENEFCMHFNIDKIKMLLKSYCPDYKGLLINIYEPTVTNAIALALLDKDIFSLNISDSDRKKLHYMLSSWSKQEALDAICNASNKLFHELQIANIAEQEYLKTTAINLYARIAAALPTNNINGIFMSLFELDQTNSSEVQFIDDDIMDNEKLRKLIDEVNSCRYITDKIAMFNQHVHSLRDCIEILNVCFWEDECIELFKSLDKTMLALLLNFVYIKQKESSDWQSETGWEQKLLRYIKE